MQNKSDDIRLRYVYRNLILRGKARLSLESARGLVGPDCAYHLYGTIGTEVKSSSRHPIKNKPSARSRVVFASRMRRKRRSPST